MVPRGVARRPTNGKLPTLRLRRKSLIGSGKRRLRDYRTTVSAVWRWKTPGDGGFGRLKIFFIPPLTKGWPCDKFSLMTPTDVLLAGAFCRSRWRPTMPTDRLGLPSPRRLRAGRAIAMQPGTTLRGVTYAARNPFRRGWPGRGRTSRTRRKRERRGVL